MQWALVAVMALGLLRECEAFAAAPLTGQRISSLAGLNAVAQVRQHQRGKMLAGVIMAASEAATANAQLKDGWLQKVQP